MSSHYYRHLGLTAAVLLVLLQSAQAIPVSAATPAGHLIISEINWANASDQWVELSNPTDSPIDFSTTPYTLTTGGQSVLLTTGKVDPKSTIILSKLAPTDAQSSLASGLNVSVQPTLRLPIGMGAYSLLQGATLVDSANSDTVIPFGGHGRSALDTEVATEQRIGMADGSQPTAWRTSEGTGKFVKSTSSLLATPGQLDVSLPAMPTSAALHVGTDPLRPTIMVMGPLGLQADVRFIDQANGSMIKSVGDVASGFLPEMPLLAAHRYTVLARSIANETFSAAITASVPLSKDGIYAPVATSTVITLVDKLVTTAPVLAAYPATTNKRALELSGTVTAGTQLVVAVNGSYQASQALVADQTAFNFSVSLLPNTVNHIEVRSKASDGTLSPSVVASVTQTMQAPATLDKTKLHLSIDGLSGMPGSATKGSLVIAYADSTLTHLLAETMVAEDGSFSPINLGQMMASTIYVVQTDAAGNVSSTIELANPVVIAGHDLQIPVFFSTISTDSVSLKLQPVSGSMGYLIKYRATGSEYTVPMIVCANSVTSCDLRKSIIGLRPGTAYTFAVAAVDSQGQASNYTEAAFQTLQTLPPNIGGSTAPLTPLPIAVTAPSAPMATPQELAPTPSPVPNKVALAPRAAATAIPAPPASVTPAPASEVSPSPDSGAVESATTQARNWTPWIILGALVGLALLATAGYFYWFGGEAGAAADAAAKPTGKEQLPPAKEVGTVKEPLDKEKNKRW